MRLHQLLNRIISMMVLIIFASLTIANNSADAYIMPSQQIIEFLSDNFIKIKSAEILLSIDRVEKGSENSEEIFEERLFLKSPNLFNFVTVESEEEKQYLSDVSFFRLFISNKKENLEIFFSRLGINLGEVAYTRIEGIIAYVIGDRSDDSPKIIIEKERFLPIFILYRSDNGYYGNTISVRFKDYQKLGKIWFPHEITVSQDDNLLETYYIQSITTNVQTDPDLLQPMGIKRFEDKEPQENLEEERLREIIKAFEEKYSQD